MNAVPDQRLAGGEARAHGLEHRRGRPDLRVAVHAGRRRRDAGEAGRLNGRVAVAAVDAQSADVMLMAEGDDLLDRVALIREVRRAHDAADQPENETGNEDRAEDGDARKRIGTAVENLSHL